MPSKISLEEFENALRKGLGRAVAYVRTTPPDQVRAPLLHACINYLGYDLQCEDTRVPWLYEMIAITGEPDWYCAELVTALEALREIPKNPRGLYEMIDLLVVFAHNGYADVKERLLRAVFTIQTPETVLSGAIPVEMLGVEGVVETVRAYSKAGEPIIHYGVDLLVQAATIYEPALTKALRAAERDDETLRTYLGNVQEDIRREEEERRAEEKAKANPGPVVQDRWVELYASRRPSLETLFSLLEQLPPESDFLDNLPTEKPLMWERKAAHQRLRMMFMHASTSGNRWYVAPPEFLEQVFERLLGEKDSGRQYCLLGAFRREVMPRFESSILALVDSPAALLSDTVAEAFSNIRHPAIRAKGRALLESRPKGRNWLSGFQLLTGSGCAEDLPLIIESLDAIALRNMDAFGEHSVIADMMPLAKIGAPAETAPIMLWVYEHSPCANCRGKSVDWLVQHHVAPGEVVEECRDDCDERIRRAVLEDI